MTCQHADDAGSYVLGALSAAERQQFEQHLADCADCAQSVRELAGLPGLLARVDAEVLTSPPSSDPVPPTLLPSLVHQVRRYQRRRSWRTAGVVAAAAVSITVVSLAVAAALDSDRTPTPAASAGDSSVVFPAGRTMVPVGDAPVRATVAFERVPWGTRLDVTCTYPADPAEYGLPPTATYALVVRTHDGRTEQVATWRSLPGRPMQLTAATAANPGDIASVQVRTEDGNPVLTLTS